MTLFSSLVGVLESAFSIWTSKEKNKYANELLNIKKAHYEEINKPDGERSDAVLDNLKHQLRLLASSFSSTISSENIANK